MRRSFIVVVLIPCIAISYFVVWLNTIDQIDEAHRSYTDRLALFRTRMEDRMGELYNIAAQVSTNERICAALSSNNPNVLREAIEELAEYRTSNTFFCEILLQTHDRDFLLTGDGTVIPSALLGNGYGGTADEVSQFEALLDEGGRISLVRLTADGLVGFLFQIPINIRKPRAMLGFFARPSTLRQMSSQANDRETFIILCDGVCIFCTGEEPAFTQVIPSGVSTARVGGAEKTLIALGNSGSTQYICMLDRRYLLFDILERSVGIIFAAVLLIIATVICATYMARRNYQPISQLTNFTLSRFPDHAQSDASPRNELQAIEAAVGWAALRNTDLLKQVDQQREWLTKSALTAIYHGETPRYVESLLRSGNCRFCTLAFCDQQSNTMLEQRVQILLDEENPWPLPACALTVNGCVTALVLIPEDVESIDETVYALAETLSAVYSERYVSDVHIGIGSACAMIDDVSRTGVEARAALERCLARGGAAVMTYTQAASVLGVWKQDAKLERLLFHSLCQGSHELALESMNALLDAAYASNSPTLVQYACIHLVDLVMSAVTDEIHLNTFQVDRLTAAQQMWMYGMYESGREKYRACVSELVRAVCDSVVEYSQRSEAVTRQRVLEYIQQYYRDANLCLESLVERFGYTYGYWSGYFRDQIGVNFSDYVWKMRLQEAKRLLQETDAPIREIVHNVGYLDASSFIRRFKLTEKTTPGEYRARTRRGENVEE